MDKRKEWPVLGQDLHGARALTKPPSTLQDLSHRLEQYLQQPLKLKLNNNKSTYLSVGYVKGTQILKLSLHSIFLQAPAEVIQAVGEYLKGNKKNFYLIKSFVNEKDHEPFFTTTKKPSVMKTKGRVYDLQKLFKEVCLQYFPDSFLPLGITWYNPKKRRPLTRWRRQQVTFGEYHASQKLIKINGIIDHPDIPKLFVLFIIYHEILHHIYPPQISVKGYSQVHHKTFKQEEKKFLFYKEVEHWRKHEMRDFLDNNHR